VPLHADDGDGGVREDAADAGAGLEVLESHYCLWCFTVAQFPSDHPTATTR
jgi:hypothetical protein